MSTKPPPGTARLILRPTEDGRVVVGGVILGNPFPDMHERVFQGIIDLTEGRIFRVVSKDDLVGRNMDQMMTGEVLCMDFPNERWPEEK